MVTIAPITMVMTGGGFVALFLPTLQGLQGSNIVKPLLTTPFCALRLPDLVEGSRGRILIKFRAVLDPI